MEDTEVKPKASRGRASSKTAEAAVDAVSQASVMAADNPQKPIVPKPVDPNQIVTVRNGFQGRLIYKSKRTGERFVWEEFGSEQDMELSELKNARNSNKKFFTDNWFMFDESWIPDYLGMGKYYQYAIPISGFDDIFAKSADEIADIIPKLSDGQKRSVAYRARQLLADGEIDSRKVIATLEECLGVELTEK